MDTTATVSLLAVIVSLATIFIVQIRRANTASSKNLHRRLMGHRALAEVEYGDVVELPAAAKYAGGGRQIHGDGLAQGHALTHDKRGR